jgi:hypothetical protein
MKKRKNELDVDTIGDGRTLSKDQEKTISEFIKTSKGLDKKRLSLKGVTSMKKVKARS